MNAKFELPSLISGEANSASQTQPLDPPQMAFSESLLAASKAFSGPEIEDDRSTSPTAWRESKSQETKVPWAVSDGQAIASKVIPQPAALPQLVALRPQTPLTNPSAEANRSPLGTMVLSQSHSGTVADQPMRNVLALTLTGSGANSAQPVVGPFQSVASSGARSGSGMARSTSKSAGGRNQGVKAPNALSAKTRNNVQDAVATGSSNTAQEKAQKTAPTTVANLGQDPLSGVSLSAQSKASLYIPSDVMSKAVQGVSATSGPDVRHASLPEEVVSALSNGLSSAPSDVVWNAGQSPAPTAAFNNKGQISRQNAFLAAVPISVPGTASTVAWNAVQISVPNAASNEVQNPLPKAVANVESIAVVNTSSETGSSAVQSSAPRAASREATNSLPKAVVIASPITTLNASSEAGWSVVQSSVPNAASREAANLLPKGVVIAAPITVLNASPNAWASTVQSSVPTAPTSEVRNPLPKADLNTLSNVLPNVPFDVVSNRVQSSVRNAAPDAAENPLPTADPGVAPIAAVKAPAETGSSAVQISVPNAASDAVENPLPKADLSAAPIAAVNAPAETGSSAVQSSVPKAAPDAVENPLAKADLNSLSIALPSAPADAVSNAVQSSAASSASSQAQGSLPSMVSTAPSNAVPDTSKKAPTSADANGVPVALPRAFVYAQSSAVLSVPLIADPVQYATQKEPGKADVASTSTAAPKDQAIVPAVAPHQSVLATGNDVLAVAADKIVAPVHSNGGVLVTSQSDVSSVNSVAGSKLSAAAAVNGKDTSKGATSDAAVFNQHVPAASDHTGSHPDSQDSAPSSDQGQGSASVQGQSAAPMQMNTADRAVAVIASVQNMSNLAPEASTVRAGVGGHAANAADNAASAPVSVPQALPVINTAKLIQSMGQSEMRVGMRSSEFGNISISTSATRNLISAQISLDHGELAKVLTAHLPEMQARLGSNQAVDVRIAMNGEQARQGAGSSGDLSNGSADASRGGRQQGGYTAPDYSAREAAEQQFSPAAVAAGDGGASTRLDIRA